LEYLTFLKENNQVRQTKMKIHLQAEKIPNKYMSHSAFIFQLDKLPNTGLSLKYGTGGNLSDNSHIQGAA